MSEQGRIVQIKPTGSTRPPLPDPVNVTNQKTDLAPPLAHHVDTIYDGWGLILSGDRTSELNKMDEVIEYGLNVRSGAIHDHLRTHHFMHLLYPLNAPEVIEPDKLYQNLYAIPEQYFEPQ